MSEAATGRRKERVQKQYISTPNAVSQPQAQRHFSPYHQLYSQQQQHLRQYSTPYMQQQAPTTPVGQKFTPQRERSPASNIQVNSQPVKSNASDTGIKSGMTVEDLKRLTKARIQQKATEAAGNPSGSTPSTSTVGNSSKGPVTPSRFRTTDRDRIPGARASPLGHTSVGLPQVPKTGMSVQELKQLTKERLASRMVPQHQNQVSGLVNNAVLTNAAKSQYRDAPTNYGNNLSNSFSNYAFDGRTPKVSRLRTSSNHSRHSLDEQMYASNYLNFLPQNPQENQYAYSQKDIGAKESGSTSSQETDEHYSSHYSSYRTNTDYTEAADDNFNNDNDQPRSALSFPEDSFPPPPPMDENGAFISSALPSWSPPPARSKKLDSSGSSFYNKQTSYYNIASKEDSSKDQNAIIAPPPGLARRPSMTVPWQVAEAVLNTPQTGSKTTRKHLISPIPSSTNKKTLTSPKSSSLKSPAAQAAAELGDMTGQWIRKDSMSSASGNNDVGYSSLSTQNTFGANSGGNGLQMNGSRRGSFGNAAEFFKFRRRSKSRLELARDVAPYQSQSFGNGEDTFDMSNLGGIVTGNTALCGIDESEDSPPSRIPTDAQSSDAYSILTNQSSTNNAKHYMDELSSRDNDQMDDSDEEDNESFDDENGSGSFVSFYNAAGVGRGRAEHRNSSASLPIPPPPPPPLTDDDISDSNESEDGDKAFLSIKHPNHSNNPLPMMSPNGVRLRKVAELARRGSLSTEDKTRAKDEIIQSSLGIGASQAAKLFSTGTRKPVSPSSSTGGTVPARAPPPTSRKTTTHESRSDVYKAPGDTVKSPSDDKNSSVRKSNNNQTLEERLRVAAQRVADCASGGDMIELQKAMKDFDALRNEASDLMNL